MTNAVGRFGSLGAVVMIVKAIVTFVPKFYKVWVSGRATFKTARWFIKAIDENNDLEGRNVTALADQMPEPLKSAYQYAFYIYPDSDSDLARSGVLLSEADYNSFLSAKGWSAFSVYAFAKTHEIIRDKAIIAPINTIKNFGNDICKYNVSDVQKWEIEELHSQSPYWYALTHSLGERVVQPVANAYFDGNVLPIFSSFATGIASVAQDITKFRLINRDMENILDYVNKNPDCVYPTSFKLSGADDSLNNARLLITGYTQTRTDNVQLDSQLTGQSYLDIAPEEVTEDL